MRVAIKLKQFSDSGVLENTGSVTSGQTGVHPQMERHVRRHLASKWSQPLHRPSIETYQRLKNEGALSGAAAFILDSGCGTGKSTQRLASLFPQHIVIGVDQSNARLAKSGVASGFLRMGNCILLRAELGTFWRLLLDDGYLPERNFLLYPNPWPKPGHMLRRWHGHPVFPQLLSLGGEIEMRCNWEIYALEFAQAMKIATGKNISVNRIFPETGISPFEQKYLERGQALFSVTVAARIANAFRLSQLMD